MTATATAQQQDAEPEKTALATIPTRRPAEVRVVNDPIAVLDTARFEHMQRIASVMAQSNLIPESLCRRGDVDLPLQQVVANCFLVVNQSVRWGMDPFAVAQCVSVVKGRLCYEGKLIAAVIEAKLGIRLKYEWDDKQGEALGITVSGQYQNETEPRTVQGTVAEWKTSRDGSPWVPKQYRKMLAYRGAREWARLHAPGLMLGVYSDEELGDLADEARANRARNVTPVAMIEDGERRSARPKPPNPHASPTATQEATTAAPKGEEQRGADQPDSQPQQVASTNRPKPPNPNAAKTQAVEAQPADDPDLPNFLDRRVKPETLLAEIEDLNTMHDCLGWADRNVRGKRLQGLTAAQRGAVDAAFLKRQQSFNRA